MNLKSFLTAGLLALSLNVVAFADEDAGKAGSTIVVVSYEDIRESAAFKDFMGPMEAKIRTELTNAMKNNATDLPMEKRIELTATVQVMQMLPQEIAQKFAPPLIEGMAGSVVVLPKGVAIASKGVSDVTPKILESLKKEDIEAIFTALVKKNLSQLKAGMTSAEAKGGDKAGDKKGADKAKAAAAA